MVINERYSAVLERISAAAEKVGRQSEEITLVAVTKTWPADVVLDAYEAGIRHFGENRAEELAAKRQLVEKTLGAESGIVWHQIGALQSRKTNLVAEHADVFHALDRLKIARRLSSRIVATGRDQAQPLPVFLEVNISGEVNKAGFDCSRWESDSGQRDRIKEAATEISFLPGLLLRGLMTMAPWQVPENKIREVFRRTNELSQWLQNTGPLDSILVDGFKLSMGMTDDFEIAIEEGATHVRIGRAIFGSRN